MIKLTRDIQSALKVARHNPHFFNNQGLKLMVKDFKNDQVFGYYQHGQLIGFISIKHIDLKLSEISWMAVLPEYQGQGIGSALLNHAMDIIRKTHSTCQVKTLAHTDPDPSYARTRHFYTKNGFISTQVIDPYPEWGPGNPCEIFSISFT